MACSRHRRALFSVQVIWHWGVPTARRNWLLGRCSSSRDIADQSCLSSANPASEEHKNSHEVLFLNLLLLRTPRRHKLTAKSHRSIYVPQAQQNSLQSALNRAAKYIQQYVRVDQSATTHASRQEQVEFAESPHVRVFCLFFLCSLMRSQSHQQLIWIFPSTAALILVTGHRLYYTILVEYRCD